MRLRGDNQSSRPAVYAEGSAQVRDCRSMHIPQFCSQLTFEQHGVVRAHGMPNRDIERPAAGGAPADVTRKTLILLSTSCSSMTRCMPDVRALARPSPVR